MTIQKSGNRLKAEISFAAFIAFGCAALMPMAFDLPTMSALLPLAMLALLIVLGMTIAITMYLRRGSLSGTLDIGHPLGVFATFGAIIGYSLAVQYLGFYTSTVIMIPLVAWVAGYRKPAGLALTTVLFTGMIYLIFSFLMGQRFPSEFFLN